MSYVLMQTTARPKAQPTPRNYATRFLGTENPLSEGGIWTNGRSGVGGGALWNNCAIENGLCYGLQNAEGVNLGSFKDGSAVLNGVWRPNQRITARVVMNSPDDGDNFPEVELFGRRVITPNLNRGIEISYSCRSGANAYLGIVDWHGPQGVEGVGFDYLFFAHDPSYGVVHGDVVMAEFSGTTVSAYKNGTLLQSVTQTSWADGAPGIGFNSETGNLPQRHGFSSVYAENL